MEFLYKLFGLQVTCEDWRFTEQLPALMRRMYRFYSARIDGNSCVVMELCSEFPTIPGLEKQIRMVRLQEAVPVILKVDQVSALRRKKLIQAHIAFLAGEQQVYLPFLATYLESREVKCQKSLGTVKYLQYSAQQLFLWYLYQEQQRVYVAKALEILPYSAMSLSRAARQLETTGLFQISKEGVNRILECTKEKDTLLERMGPLLRTPVKCRGYVERSAVTKDMVLSGESARRAMKGENPGRVVTYAVDEKKFDLSMLQTELFDADRQVSLEIWHYDPQIFAKHGRIDAISMKLCR